MPAAARNADWTYRQINRAETAVLALTGAQFSATGYDDVIDLMWPAADGWIVKGAVRDVNEPLHVTLRHHQPSGGYVIAGLDFTGLEYADETLISNTGDDLPDAFDYASLAGRYNAVLGRAHQPVADRSIGGADLVGLLLHALRIPLDTDATMFQQAAVLLTQIEFSRTRLADRRALETLIALNSGFSLDKFLRHRNHTVKFLDPTDPRAR